MRTKLKVFNWIMLIAFIIAMYLNFSSNHEDEHHLKMMLLIVFLYAVISTVVWGTFFKEEDFHPKAPHKDTKWKRSDKLVHIMGEQQATKVWNENENKVNNTN